jgi:hypothetical protein
MAELEMELLEMAMHEVVTQTVDQVAVALEVLAVQEEDLDLTVQIMEEAVALEFHIL